MVFFMCLLRATKEVCIGIRLTCIYFVISFKWSVLRGLSAFHGSHAAASLVNEVAT